MARKILTGARRAQFVGIAVAHLKEARDLLAECGCKEPAKRVRAALRSAEGAKRNADRFANQETRS